LKFKGDPEQNDIEVNLEKLLDIVIKLVSYLDNNSKVTLKELLFEIKIIHIKIIDILLPFYEINNNTIIQNEFRDRCKNFNEVFQKDLMHIDKSCNVIKNKIDNLANNHGWKLNKYDKLLQVFGRKEDNSKKEELLKELEKLINNFYANNKIFYKKMQNLQKQLDKELGDVNLALDRGDITSARMSLQLFFEESKFSLDNIKQLLHFLKRIIDYL
jgi:hypothetical protein